MAAHSMRAMGKASNETVIPERYGGTKTIWKSEAMLETESFCTCPKAYITEKLLGLFSMTLRVKSVEGGEEFFS